LVPLTEQRARQAAQIAITCRLRGADAVYVALAQELGTTLITWDAELLARGALAVPTMTPTDWLAANPV
jgi:predicted nucleic acid-binding protein